ncbi:maleylpyruvate isomerase family mycothiol-dependent enzyme [Streptomyces sp. NPDC058274]|uniref:maleylpyruvate isomerase family mycothiol-dependent enzyme n=1 Tax=Streptomyces sp. NPDC058274 TaxID=3346416 RepID=UPI0036EE973B
MEIAQFLETLGREGPLLAAAAEEAGSDAEVPTCPGWQVRDLVRHTGMVHRWATAFVSEGYTSYHPDEGLPDLDGDELLAWFREGHRRLVDTLTTAPPDVQCWSFLPAPSPLAFWARRQAHETTVHRVDAESALGGTPSSIATDVALDGIDELLRGFHVRARSRVRSQTPRVLRVRATDTDTYGGGDGAAAPAPGAVWTVRLSSEPLLSERGESGEADCELTGPAAQLYLALWNRRPFPNVTGDAELAVLWREKSAVTWN